MTTKTTERYAEIDLLKGLGCVLMLVGHSIRVKMPAPGVIDKVILHIMDFSGPMFFFASGMNVMTFLEHNEKKPGFNATRFYLWSAALLFLLGFTYNINRASLGFMDIFQGVAVATAGVYLLMRTRLSTAAHFVIILLIYGFYAQFRVRLELDRIIPGFHEMRLAIPPGADITYFLRSRVLANFLRSLGSGRSWMFINFSPFSWGVFFYVGALCYRSIVQRKHSAKPWIVFFAAIFVVAPFVYRELFAPNGSLLDAVFLASYLDLMLRGIPSYVLMTLGGAGLTYLLMRRYYRGTAAVRNRVARWFAARMEVLGKESLLFLVAHWWVLDTILLPLTAVNFVTGRAYGYTYELNIYLRAALTLTGTFFAVPFFARLRDRLSQLDHYGAMIAVFMVLTFIVSIVFLPFSPSLGHYLTYGASFGFAFVYPYLRVKLRKRYTTPVSA
jgi:hypothetical protein